MPSWAESGQNKRGFTLIELLVVLVILGAIASLSTLWVASIKRNEVRRSLTLLKLSIRRAFIESVVTGREIRLHIEGNCRGIVINLPEKLRRIKLPKGTRCYAVWGNNREPLSNSTYWIYGTSTDMPDVEFEAGGLKLSLHPEELIFPVLNST